MSKILNRFGYYDFTTEDDRGMRSRNAVTSLFHRIMLQNVRCLIKHFVAEFKYPDRTVVSVGASNLETDQTLDDSFMYDVVHDMSEPRVHRADLYYKRGMVEDFNSIVFEKANSHTSVRPLMSSMVSRVCLPVCLGLVRSFFTQDGWSSSEFFPVHLLTKKDLPKLFQDTSERDVIIGALNRMSKHPKCSESKIDSFIIFQYARAVFVRYPDRCGNLTHLQNFLRMGGRRKSES